MVLCTRVGQTPPAGANAALRALEAESPGVATASIAIRRPGQSSPLKKEAQRARQECLAPCSRGKERFPEHRQECLCRIQRAINTPAAGSTGGRDVPGV